MPTSQNYRGHLNTAQGTSSVERVENTTLHGSRLPKSVFVIHTRKEEEVGLQNAAKR